MTAPGKMPERIKAVIEADWHDGSTGRHILGGEWRAKWRAGTEYTRSDLCTPAPDVAELVAALRDIAVMGSDPSPEVMQAIGRNAVKLARAAIAAWEGK